MAWIYRFLCSENDRCLNDKQKGKLGHVVQTHFCHKRDSKYLSNITISELNSDSVVIKRYSMIRQPFEDSLFGIVIAKTNKKKTWRRCFCTLGLHMVKTDLFLWLFLSIPQVRSTVTIHITCSHFTWETQIVFSLLLFNNQTLNTLPWNINEVTHLFG